MYLYMYVCTNVSTYICWYIKCDITAIECQTFFCLWSLGFQSDSSLHLQNVNVGVQPQFHGA